MQLVQQLRSKISVELDDYLTSEYQAVALHAQSTVVDCNPAAAELFGYSVEEIIGINAWALFSVESASLIMEKLVSKSEEPYRVIGKKKDETEFNVEIKGQELTLNNEALRLVLLRKIE